MSNKWLNASGVALQAGDGKIILLTPNGVGRLRKRLDVRGDHVVGIGIQVEDVRATKALLGKHVQRSRLGSADAGSVTVDATSELGVYVSFRQ
jgi:hypothetical protein